MSGFIDGLKIIHLLNEFVTSIDTRFPEENKKYPFLTKLKINTTKDYEIRDKLDIDIGSLLHAVTSYGSCILLLVKDNCILGYLMYENNPTFINNKYSLFNPIEISTLYIPPWNRGEKFSSILINNFLTIINNTYPDVNAITLSVAKEHDESSNLVNYYKNLGFYISHTIKGQDYLEIPKEGDLNKTEFNSFKINGENTSEIDGFLMIKEI